MAITRVVQIAIKTVGKKALDGLNETISNIDFNLVGLIKTLGIVTAALTAFAVVSAKSRRELEGLARQAKLSVEEFQALAFATQQYGINAEQIADISKDLQDRLGEFATTGTGTFQDFADVVGLSTEQAVEFAKELQGLSGDQVIGAVVSELEDAGASAEQTAFVLESLGNDLSRLAPLFANNASELERLTATFIIVNRELQLTEEQTQNLVALNENIDLLGSAFANAGQKITASFAPVLNEVIDKILEALPEAIGLLEDFVQFFDEDFSLDLGGQPAQGQDNGGGGGKGSGGQRDKERKRALTDLAEQLQAEIDLFRFAIETRQKEESEAIANSLIQQEQRIEQSLEKEREAIEQFGLLKLEELGIIEQFENQRTDIEKAGADERIRISEQEANLRAQANLKGAASFIQGLQQINEKSKGLQRASIVANTAVAVMETLSRGGFWAIPLAAIVAGIGVQQLGQVGKQSYSGGSLGSGDGALDSAGINTPTIAQQTTINTVENNLLSDLANELSRFDPQEPIPASYAQRIILGVDQAMADGTITGGN